MAERKLLKGKVADILGQYEIAINIGRNDGVEEGMEFVVLGGRSILDPDNHKKLGTYNYNKAKVRVVKIEEHYSVATSETTETVMFASLEDLFFQRPKTTREVLSSKVTLDREVAVGDVVVQAKKE